MKNWKLFFLLLLTVILIGPVTTAEEIDSPPVETKKLSLADCLNLALENNLDIAISRLGPETALLDIAQAGGDFEPTLSLESSKQKSITPSSSSLDGSSKPERRTFNNSLSVSKKFVTGATTRLSVNADQTRTNSSYATLNPSWSTSARVSLTQPLWRGVGAAYNKSSILIARNNKNISDEQFRLELTEIVFEIQSAYWNLVNAIKQKEVKDKSLSFARSLLEANRAKVQAGLLSPLEKLQAEVGVANQQEGILLARKAIEDAEDALKSLIQPIKQGDLRDWLWRIRPLDEPQLIETGLTFNQCLDSARQHRPELIQQKKAIANREINLNQSRHSLKPAVDLIASYRYGGLDETAGESFSVLNDWDYPTWKLGLVLEYPLINRAARSQFKEDQLAKRLQNLELKKLEQRIIVEIREARRAVETGLKRVTAVRQAKELARRQLDAEQKKLQLGSSTSHQVLEIQEELAQAESNEKKALIDHNIAIRSLQKATGTLLQKNNIMIK